MSKDPFPRHDITPEVQRQIVKWVVQSAFGIVGYGAVLFPTDGRLDWG
jgi:hypothetical protein